MNAEEMQELWLHATDDIRCLFADGRTGLLVSMRHWLDGPDKWEFGFKVKRQRAVRWLLGKRLELLGPDTIAGTELRENRRLGEDGMARRGSGFDVKVSRAKRERSVAARTAYVVSEAQRTGSGGGGRTSQGLRADRGTTWCCRHAGQQAPAPRQRQDERNAQGGPGAAQARANVCCRAAGH